MKEKNSKVVKIMRTIPFSQAANIDLTEFFGGAVRGVGSYFKGKKPGSGLTFAEEKLLMPELVNLPADDRDFRKAVELYFTDITTRIPEKGLPLEIGLEDNTKPLAADNMPNNVEEYVIYKHAISHPHTAMSEEEAKGNQLKTFYILDETKTALALKEDNDTRDEAIAEYLLLKKDSFKVEMVLTNLGEDTRGMDVDTMVRKIKEYIDNDDIENAKNFKKLVNDKNLEPRFRIIALERAGILKKIGLRYVIADSGDIIGSIEEAVVWWLDKSNSETVGVLRARYQEFARKKNLKEEPATEKE